MKMPRIDPVTICMEQLSYGSSQSQEMIEFTKIRPSEKGATSLLDNQVGDRRGADQHVSEDTETALQISCSHGSQRSLKRYLKSFSLVQFATDRCKSSDVPAQEKASKAWHFAKQSLLWTTTLSQAWREASNDVILYGRNRSLSVITSKRVVLKWSFWNTCQLPGTL